MSDNFSDNIKEYLFIGIIGSGCFSTCYKVSHKTSKNVYVWKAIDYAWMSEDDKEVLISEVETLSTIRHPNIIQFYNPINHRTTLNLYLRMQYCDGGDLSALIKKHKKLNNYIDETFIWCVLYQVTRAVQAFHSKFTKVLTLYCDIKPAHVFLDGYSKVKLGGFCLNRSLMKDYNIEPDVSCDDVCYFSPEILSDGKFNKKAEIWSLGCLAYELTSLSTPFAGSDAHRLAENIQNGKRNKIPVHFSSDLQKIVDLMLTADPEARPSIEAILYHPLVVSHIASNSFQQLSIDWAKKGQEKEIASVTKAASQRICAKCRDIDIRSEAVRQKEAALKSKENHLKDKEILLSKREKQVALMEQLSREKIMRTESYLKQCKKAKKSGKPITDLNDSSYSADPGDTSILPTSSKLDPNEVAKPSFLRHTMNRRTVHFGINENVSQIETTDFGKKGRGSKFDRFYPLHYNEPDDTLFNKSIHFDSKAEILQNVPKRNKREIDNKENRKMISNRYKIGSLLSLKADTLETSRGILETHFR